MKTSEYYYSQDFLHHDLLSHDEEKRLIRLSQSGDTKARDNLIEHNQRLVMKFARRYYINGVNRVVEFMDLIQAGNEGMIIAIRKFDLSTNNKFSTYASLWIQQKIRRLIVYAFATQNVKMTYESASIVTKLINEKHYHLMKHGVEPTTEWLAKKTGIDRFSVDELLLASTTLRLDAPIGKEKDNTSEEFLTIIRDKNTPSEDTQLIGIDVNNAVGLLPEDAQTVIIKRFGLDGKGRRTYKEIAKEAKIPLSQIRDINEKGMQTLRAYLKEPAFA